MLIISSSYRGAGKQKPRQWGPVNAVRSSVSRSLDSAGIDPKSLELYNPLWSGDSTNQINIGTDLSAETALDMLGTIEYRGSGWYWDRSVAEGGLRPIATTPSILQSLGVVGYPSTLVINMERTDVSQIACHLFGWYKGIDVIFDSGTYEITIDIFGLSVYAISAPDMFDIRSFVMRWNGVDTYEIYLDGALRGTIAGPSDRIIRTGFGLGLERSDRTPACWNGYIHSLQVFSAALYDSQIQYLVEEPYSALQPLSPVYYSFSGTTPGGTPVSANYDLRFTAVNEYIFDYDSKLSVSSAQSLMPDTIIGVSNQKLSSFDSLAGASNAQLNIHDSSTVIHNDILSYFDTQLVAGNQQSVVIDFDTIVKVRNELLQTFDNSALISNNTIAESDINTNISNDKIVDIDSRTQVLNEILSDVDTRLIAKNSITGAYDTRLTAGNQNTITVSFDTVVALRNSLLMAIDNRVVISNDKKVLNDSKTAASMLVASHHDSKATSSTLIDRSYDTAAAISGLQQVIQNFDTNISVITEVSVLVDTLLIAAAECTSILCDSDIDNIADALMARIEASPALMQAIAEAVWRYER